MRIYGALVFVALVGCGGSPVVQNCPGVVAGDACNPSCNYGICSCASGVLECQSACNPTAINLTLTGSPIAVTTMTAKEPAFTGGSISDGTYVLTSATWYGGGTHAASDPMRAVYRFSGEKVDIVEDDGGGSYLRSATFSTNGDRISFSFSCGAGVKPYEGSYSATASTLTLTPPTPGPAVPTLTLTKQ